MTIPEGQNWPRVKRLTISENVVVTTVSESSDTPVALTTTVSGVYRWDFFMIVLTIIKYLHL